MANFGKYFSKNIIMLQIFAQFRPEPQWPLLFKLLYYCWRLFIYFCLISTIIFSYIGIRVYGFVQISDIAMNILNMLLYSSISLRSAYFMFCHEDVQYLVLRMNAVMRDSSCLTPEPKTMKKSRFFSDVCLIGWWAFVMSSGLFLALAPLVKSAKEIPLPMWLPYDWQPDEYYYPTMLIQTFAQIFMVSSFANIEMFNVCANILMTSQFHILGYDFANIIPNALLKCEMPQEDIDTYLKNREDKILITKIQQITKTEKFKLVVIDNFKLCINHHQDILNFRDDFYAFISPIMAVEVNFLFVYMIFVLFTWVTTDDKTLYPAFIQYFFGIIGQIYINTLAGEKLTNQVDDLRETFYDIPWYFCDRIFMKNFKIVQLRMTRNDYLKAGKVLPISLETWLEFMKKAASFFAVLRQVNDQ